MAIQKVKNKNGEWIIVSGVNKPLTIDSSISDTSENPVQNKAVKEYVDDAISNANLTNYVAKDELKTLNGESLLGEGDIKLELSDYTKVEVHEAFVDEVASIASELTTEINNTKLELIDDIVIAERVTASALVDLNKRLNSECNARSDENATKEDVDQLKSYLTNELIDDEEVLAVSLIDLNDRLTTSYENVRFESATKTELSQNINAINEIIIANEEVTAAALTDLNDRIFNKQDVLINGENIRTINGKNILGSGDLDISTVVDSSLSLSSENPIQNKVLTQIIQELTSRIEALEANQNV